MRCRYCLRLFPRPFDGSCSVSRDLVWADLLESEGDERANSATEVEDDPEQRDTFHVSGFAHPSSLTSSLLVREGITEHDSALGDPEEGRTQSQNSSARDHESAVACSVVIEERTGVHRICPSSEQDGGDPENVKDGLGNKYHSCGADGKQCDGSVGADLEMFRIPPEGWLSQDFAYSRIQLTAATHT